jgi:hypothetical protein
LGNGTSAPLFVAPGTTGNVLTSNGTTWQSTAPTASGVTLGTPVNSTSGTAIDFTGIPSGTKIIIVSFINVSTNGTASKHIQFGNASGFQTTNYTSTSSTIGSSTVATFNTTEAFRIYSVLEDSQLSGSITFTLEDSSTNTWSGAGVFSDTNNTNTFVVGGKKLLTGGVLTKIRITSQTGGDTFDNGAINIAYQ